MAEHPGQGGGLGDTGGDDFGELARRHPGRRAGDGDRRHGGLLVPEHRRSDGDESLSCHYNTPVHYRGHLYGIDGRQESGARLRCVGRTDDMLIVRGVNVFPSAVREVISQFAPDVSGHMVLRPRHDGVKQDPPLPVRVELGSERPQGPGLAQAIRERIRDVLVVQTDVELVPWGTLQRSEYKSRLVER